MIYLIGIGPGDPKFLLNSFSHYCQLADHVYGSRRQLELLPADLADKGIELPKLMQLVDYLQEDQASDLTSVVLASGDPNLYGIANFLRRYFDQEELQVYPGISSLQYIFTAAGLSMNDCYLTSSHGREPNFDLMVQLPKTALVTDDKINPYVIAQELIKRGGSQMQLIVGENLTYPDEKITRYESLTEVTQRDYKMNVVVVLNER